MKQSRFEELVARITVTLSIFNFSTWFFAQIVENRETQLSSPFLGPGDNFSKSYDENQISTRHVHVNIGEKQYIFKKYSRSPSGNCYINLRHLFPRVTPDPGLQFLQVGSKWLYHVLSRPSPEEHDLRLLHKPLFPGRYWAVSHAKNGFSTKDLPFSEPFSKTFSMKAVFCVRNGSVAPREEGFAKQPQVMLLGGWSTEDVV